MTEPSDVENDAQAYNPGHQIEGLDRCFTIITMIDQLLTGHPAVVRAEGEPLVSRALDAIGSLYQLIGNLDEIPPE